MTLLVVIFFNIIILENLDFGFELIFLHRHEMVGIWKIPWIFLVTDTPEQNEKINQGT